MKRVGLFFILVCFLTFFGCNPKQFVVENNSTKIDSVYIFDLQYDSIYIKDSVFVEKGDTITIYKERDKFVYKFEIDTIMSYKVDSVYIEKPIIIEKELNWFENTMLILGKISLFIVLGVIIWNVVKWYKKS